MLFICERARNWLWQSSALFAAWVLAVGIVLFETSASYAEGPACTTTWINLRQGPGTQYGRTAVIPRNEYVRVNSCNQTLGWCSANWRQYSGWISSRYLVFLPAGPYNTGSAYEWQCTRGQFGPVYGSPAPPPPVAPPLWTRKPEPRIVPYSATPRQYRRRPRSGGGRMVLD